MTQLIVILHHMMLQCFKRGNVLLIKVGIQISLRFLYFPFLKTNVTRAYQENYLPNVKEAKQLACIVHFHFNKDSVLCHSHSKKFIHLC